MLSFDSGHTDELKAWLIKELEPICDADPEVLSDYVLALLKHDGSDEDLQAKLLEQLEDFLAEQTGAFVDKVLDALRSQSYLPHAKRANAVAEEDNAVAGSSRKRAADDEGRYTPAKAYRDAEGADASRRERRGLPQDGRQGNRPRQPCRDFHQRGFCARGDSCKYDHTLPPSGPAGNGFHPMPSMMGMQGPPQMAQSFGGPPQQMQGAPSGPGNGFMGVGGQFGPGGMGGWNGTPQMGAAMGQQPYEGGFGGGEGQEQQGMMGRGDFGHRGGRGGMRGGRGGGARGAFDRRATSNTTLVIENVPAEHLELVKVNEYFKKFGTITNIQIDVDNKKALVSYSQPAEAKAAHSSPEVIFDNRFVKVYFQKLDEATGRPEEHPRAPPKPAPAPPLKSNFVPGQNKFVRPNLAQEKAKEVQEAAQKKLDQLMAEQKGIMNTVTSTTATAEEKKAAMARFGTLDGEIKQATEEVRAAVSGAANATSTPAHDTAAPAQMREQKQREQLDRELEALKGGAAGSGNESTTQELKEKLARLQAEAEQLGIDPADPAASFEVGGYRGGYRGRGRATFRGASRGFYRGRGNMSMGGAVRGSMSLDNRPSRVIVTDIPEGAQSEKGTKVKDFFRQFGETQTVEERDDGSLLVHYKVRASGERALRSGLDVPDVGPIKATWATDSAAASTEQSGHDASTDSQAYAHDGEGYDGEEGDREDHFRR